MESNQDGGEEDSSARRASRVVEATLLRAGTDSCQFYLGTESDVREERRWRGGLQ